ncbi:hypothetical protein [Deinococcus pimensis]|uniref:hypothetical protein n=1 Tax=Deinococcus pimensis TaxID=309888 RepID=UPI00048375EE|nr:hypothetical protein [Deinococcus pimensis]
MRTHLLFAAVTLALSSAAVAQTPGKAAPTQPVVQGTKQLDGENAKLGQTFTIGKQSPLNFTLRAAEYSTNRVVIGGNIYYPKADEKLLVLRYTVQNPQKGEVQYYWGDLAFTAVDALDRNHEYVQAVARDGTTDKLEVRLKPAQKIDVVTLIVVPAAGPVPKLIVQRPGDRGAAVLRYDLRGQARPVAAPAADPADTSGSTALARVPAAKGKPVQLKYFDVTFQDAAFTTEPLGGRAPAPGKRYLTATFVVRNGLTRDVQYYWGDFKASLRDADGERVEYNQTMLKASRDEKSSGTLPVGEDVRVRFFWELPEKVAGDRVQLTDESGRTFEFDVSGVK